MAKKPTKLSLVVSKEARRSIDEIWEWNANQYGVAQAEAYIDLVWRHVEKLESAYLQGTPANRFRYMIIQRRSRRHGHVLIYEILETSVFVLSVFHTAQDWHAFIDRLSQAD